MNNPNLDFILICSAIFVALISLLVYNLKRLDLYKAAAKYNGPPALPILGNVLLLGTNEGFYERMMALMDRYPSPSRFWLGPNLVICSDRIEDVKAILFNNKAINKAPPYKFAQAWLGNGLIMAPGAIWRAHRRVIEPIFNSKVIFSFVEMIASRSELMTEKMELELNRSDEFKIADYIAPCVFDIISEFSMGFTVETQGENAANYRRCMKRVIEIASQRPFKPWLNPKIIFNLSTLGREQSQCIKTLHQLTNNVIMNRKKERKVQASDKPDSETTSSKKKVFLDFLLELAEGEKFTDTEIREELDTIIVGGNDSTSSALGFILLMLATHPDVQVKVHKELDEIYGGCAELERCSVGREDLRRMEYLENVIKETLRLFPTIPAVARIIQEDIRMGEYTLPKGCWFLVPIVAVHRNPLYWENPLNFDPDRFLPEQVSKRPSYCYLSFSTGPRNCLGSKFAMMNMKTILATVLRKYVMRKDASVKISDIKFTSEAVTRPVHPITLRIERRQ